jgi:Uma2 family endonuclease
MADDAHQIAISIKPAPAVAGPRRFTRAEFQAMIAAGILEEGSRVELVGGEIVEMAGEGYAHGNGQDMLWRVLAGILTPGWEALTGRRVDLDASSEVYPDILVQRVGVPIESRGPSNVVLIVEVADSSIARDRDIKGPRYAAAGFSEFWIFEPTLRRLWVHREPKPDGQWGLVFMREGEETVAPLFAPNQPIHLPIVPAPPAEGGS